MKNHRTQKNQIYHSSWTTDQDCYLIEHHYLSLQELCQHLPYSEEEIQMRRKVLGLTQRDRQMLKLL
ncbi:hypothetical protein [Acinetobacter sp. Marseille-Q1618]|uniref:hypothetical protein n=1 Tax=Acinetobacter sp. Marseille-Q1618 TaxID=2697502 RepID=UPI0020C32968|nr:hypothetical protein [Acinetobacter sp. Marseille-Q1618]